MEFGHDNVRLCMVNEDRLSSLPDELIHQILSFIDTKFAVQTCLLSSRWKHLWKSVPCLSFCSWNFKHLPKFAKLVSNVLSRRNQQIEVSSVNLSFYGAASQVFVRKIADYAFSHNIQNLNVYSSPKNRHQFPLCLFSSPTLKQFNFSSPYYNPCLTPKTPWDFPALTTLHLSEITLCDDETVSIDLFSKCVNLKNLTLQKFIAETQVFDIITPRLSNLVLIDGKRLHSINVIAPQLENLTIIRCSIKYLNAPSQISSFCYRDYYSLQLSKHRSRSLNKVSVTLNLSQLNMPYREEDARDAINMLQELHSAKFLTLNLDIVECLSSFPDLLSHLPSPFSNLICLNIDSSRDEAYKVKISNETRNFLLENSPDATFITDLPEEPPTKAMKAKDAREKKKAKQIADVASHMKELQASLENENMLLVERKQAKEKTKVALEDLMVDLLFFRKYGMMQSESERAQIEVVVSGLEVQITALLEEMWDLIKQVHDDILVISKKETLARMSLEKLPKRLKAEMEARYSHQLQETKNKIYDAYRHNESDKVFPKFYSRKLLLSSEASSSSPIIPTPATST